MGGGAGFVWYILSIDLVKRNRSFNIFIGSKNILSEMEMISNQRARILQLSEPLKILDKILN